MHMAIVKVKFRAEKGSCREGVIFYKVIHGSTARQIQTGYRLLPAEWDAGRIVSGTPDREAYLGSLRTAVAKDTAHLKAIIARLERAGHEYTPDTVAEQFNCRRRGFVSFATELNHRLIQIGKKRTAETYACVLNSLIRFLGTREIALKNFDSNLMAEYEAYLKSTGVCANTSSFYMRNLRAMYNRAVERGLVAQRNPFRHVYTGVDKTVKRAVPLKAIRAIRDLDLEDSPASAYARDVFMFLFYTRGMSFVDMAYLKKTDLKNGVLSYRRRKTNQQLFIKWEKQMQEIVDKYDTSGTPYLMPVIRDAGSDARKQYLSAAHLVNSKLKKIGARIGLTVPLTSYVARHAWASIAKSKNISVSVISEAMGHDSESTTRIYLASLDTKIVDKANSMVINSL